MSRKNIKYHDNEFCKAFEVLFGLVQFITLINNDSWWALGPHCILYYEYDIWLKLNVMSGTISLSLSTQSHFLYKRACLKYFVFQRIIGEKKRINTQIGHWVQDIFTSICDSQSICDHNIDLNSGTGSILAIGIIWLRPWAYWKCLNYHKLVFFSINDNIFDFSMLYCFVGFFKYGEPKK